MQDWNNISDDNAEYMTNDRLSFQRFLGMEMGRNRRTQRRHGSSKRSLAKIPAIS
ncbi:MAG: transposase [Lachnospiraceae bacterium]|nr:transposase [Lachnospiraceae bacterium]